MQIITSLLIAVIVLAIVFSISYFLYRGKEKVDKGMAINYYRLSYRRKLMRTIYSAPLILAALIFIFNFAEWPVPLYLTFCLLVIVGFILQVLYNYYKWKNTEQPTLRHITKRK